MAQMAVHTGHWEQPCAMRVATMAVWGTAHVAAEVGVQSSVNRVWCQELERQYQ